jgi:2-amino-4-hydroxy-6-hydroxymethyldihydropteridine diphosphokinase
MIEDLVLETSVLQIPHPRLSTRRFVLEPLVELAPHLKHPVLDRTMSQLLEALQS